MKTIHRLLWLGLFSSFIIHLAGGYFSHDQSGYSHEDHEDLEDEWPKYQSWFPRKEYIHHAAPHVAHHAFNNRDYGYSQQNAPDTWAEKFPSCRGRRQSPIDLNSKYMDDLEVPRDLKWVNYWTVPPNMSLVNSGHTVQLTGAWSNETAPSIGGGVLESEYQFSQLHFHWGMKNNVGSEHTIDGYSYPMEMHSVHFKKEYGTQEEAEKNKDGLVVVAYLLEISPYDNEGLSPLVGTMGDFHGWNVTTVNLPVFPLAALASTFTEDYVVYEGSLTTPPCSEIVTWIVSSTPIRISKSQLQSFRHLNELGEIPVKNYRPVQKLNGRSVYYVF